ncbi:MAG TPA: hypothetical protein VLJ41_11210 [Segetibacter sp.]|nr:hypothetical protein [Segetibacter sp.]
MLLYFEFEEKRRQADVVWPKGNENIIVHITDKEITNDLPADLYYEIDNANKVVFTIEDIANKRLIELQNTIARKLQEISQ